ncbi:hypothetical protein SAMN05421780_103193 [Flexibacter flexilis DSM 6793]|uniref:Uncharacterized protein n=1 Tax=Flexibacter flexilis DSM 6793 TaxID=927664 RepID=A0A1I1H3W8_9BACT|nr:hypothetical protein SAMN05421780_103193 [Flexibacter flexilis DSM 6793]
MIIASTFVNGIIVENNVFDVDRAVWRHHLQDCESNLTYYYCIPKITRRYKKSAESYIVEKIQFFTFGKI